MTSGTLARSPQSPFLLTSYQGGSSQSTMTRVNISRGSSCRPKRRRKKHNPIIRSIGRFPLAYLNFGIGTALLLVSWSSVCLVDAGDSPASTLPVLPPAATTPMTGPSSPTVGEELSGNSSSSSSTPLPPILPPSYGTTVPLQPCDRSRKVFTSSYGEISDGPTGANYTQDSHCEWLIKARNDSQFITLTFQSMGTECSYDYIFVYDGDSFRSPLLGSFSGKTEPQQVVATSGSMLILLYSDTNYVLEGFKASFSVSNCPNNCSSHGKCVGHRCVCHGDWVGYDCSRNACPQNCGAGFCRGEHCRCPTGYTGQSCSLQDVDPVANEWHWLSDTFEGLSPRAAHSAIYVAETDALYVFGGYDLNNILGTLQIYHFKRHRWEDEWGMKIRNPQTNIHDKDLLKAVLDGDESEAGDWGLSKQNLFKQYLYVGLNSQYQPADKLKAHNDTLSYIQDQLADTSRPVPRYGHAAQAVANGFVVYGGKLGNGSLSSELWFYNVASKEWSLRATKSRIRPPPLTRHTLTKGSEGWLYLFGGSREDGLFSSKLYRLKLNWTHADEEQWELIRPRGGKELDVRIVAHTTNYHHASNTLFVYGGVVAGVARFSRLSDRLFAFQLDNRHWTEVMYPRTPLRDAYIPRERAFHTTTSIGNYLIVFGGYSHRHNKEEICYDNQMYLYHLGCHTWINPDVLGTASERSVYPKLQGVFAHAAAVRMNNALLIVGGYHGNVNGDLLAYTLPPMLVVKGDVPYDPEILCSKHGTVTECLSDPECGWCSADGVCYGRTVGANCTTNLQTTRCPGICPALGDCHACLIHGSTHGEVTKVENVTSTVAVKLRLGQCSWCVQNARCHYKDDNYGVCGEETPGRGPGWWGVKGTEVLTADMCTALDKRPGLTFLKYLHPVNLTMPDNVAIVNATMVDFNAPATATHMEYTLKGEMMARLLGFVHPSKSWDLSSDVLVICSTNSKSELAMAWQEEGVNRSVLVQNTTNNCSIGKWPTMKAFVERIKVDFQARRQVGIGVSSSIYGHQHQHSKMGLEHNGTSESAKAFTFEYLEPYSNGSCGAYRNCLHCLSDSACGWCDLTGECLGRGVNESLECSVEGLGGGELEWKYLLVQPSHCANCSNYIDCEQCVESDLCEWWAEDARCARRGRAGARKALHTVDNCPASCHARRNCSACLDERGRCVWCEATQQCFSFSVYTSEYQFGLCREWLDQTMPLLGAAEYGHPEENENEGGDGDENKINQIGLFPNLKMQQCKSCAQFSNCTSCLRSLSCGWCFDRDNPIDGRCLQGDFNRSMESCARALNTTESEAEWAYAQCPDVDECGLGLHDCHKEAKCTNTHGSYSCHCRRGFVGDGRTVCERTCFETCVNGVCEGAPDYQCKCNLGWTGADCTRNCGCNNHSACAEAVGKCDKCEEWTEGEFCERCKAGSFGNATAIEGCRPCDCNEHGNEALGICDSKTGECFCQDNTEGMRCEFCNLEFYGDPLNGGHCYFQCEARGMLTHVGRQGFGSLQSHRSSWGGPETKECLWIIQPRTQQGTSLNDSLIQLTIEKRDLNVSCEDNSVYVYDGRPDLSGYAQQSQLLSVFCSEDSQQTVIEAKTSHMTVYYKQGPSGQGFNAMYNILSCSSRTCDSRHVCNDKGDCVCPQGFIGPDCAIERCPRNCSASAEQGVCDENYGRCICAKGFAGKDCSIALNSKHLQSAQLFNSRTLTDQFKHLRKTLPRFGHSLFIDKRSNLWMFGGYSLSHGPLNDIRQFDTKNNTWMQVTVDSTPDDKMPTGRYFHGAEIVYAAQAIYIYGGLTSRGEETNASYKGKILGDFWKFGLQSQRWEVVELDKVRPPPLAGHTLTRVKTPEKESLVLIGGISVNNGIQNEIWEYNLETMVWEKLSASGAGPIGIYGHSTVYHGESQALYVFGGVEFQFNRTQMSNKLYALQYNMMSWSELPPFTEINRQENHLPRARFLHSAVTTDNYMLIFGGRTEPFNATDLLVAYVYKCNFWIRLTEDSDIVGILPPPTYAQAMTIDPESGAVYVTNGWDGTAQSRVTRFTLPADLCQLWSRGKYLCRHYMGCSFCTKDEGGVQEQQCFASSRSNACQTATGRSSINDGAVCNEEWLSKRRCMTFKTCTECLASWPVHQEQSPICQWCENCEGVGECQPAGMECQMRTPDQCTEADEDNVRAIGLLEQCPSLECAATDCEGCQALSLCSWVVCPITDEPECMPTEHLDNLKWNATLTCPQRCREHRNCTACLGAESSEGGWNTCRWSTLLNECISPSYQPLYCTGGVCGLVLDETEQQSCPEPCSSYTQCGTCLRHAHCGWCAREAVDGEGICTEGSLESPSEYPAAATCSVIYALKRNVSLEEDEVVKWHYVRCPAEDECTNGHHTCDLVAQRCVDANVGYQCVCAEGYKEESGKCMPTCRQGCVRGVCTTPNVCDCNFGYVGENCSIQCQCNGHSECEGPDKLDACLECRNNTLGAQCDRCLPFFVGDPKNGGECVPCSDYCNGHSAVCVGKNAEHMVRNMTKQELQGMLKEGPMADAICLRCDNRTDGDRCETCIHGHFRGSENHRDLCRPCECHGHGDMCDPVTGEKCNCGNNTESDNTCSATSSKNSAQQCWSVQCSKCKESYSGTPIDGHQCYKAISAESKMCFDAKAIDECKMKPAPLKPGQLVFFVIQPRYMNVDIRIIIDVTQGDIDLFMSPQEDSFVVMTNKSTGTHQVLLDNHYSWVRELDGDNSHPLHITPSIKYEFLDGAGGISPGGGAGNVTITAEEKVFWTPTIGNCRSLSGSGFYVRDKYAKDLSTYITLNQCNTLLRVFGLKNRLVLTLPQVAHNLTTTRFFMALRANAGPTASYGLVFFRQDQSHIDLFVFFSVFFSCFFLFLAVCVVMWKAKQAADVRRARRRQFVEMLHMAKRPFASIAVLVNENSPFCATPLQNRRNRNRIKAHNLSVVSSGSTVQPLTGQVPAASGATSGAGGGGGGAGASGNPASSEIRLVAIEPTADNLAAVGTVFVRLPGKFRTPVGLVLGSTLMTMPRLSTGGNNRMLRRRRNSHRSSHFQPQAGGGGGAGHSGGNAQQGHQVHPMQ